MKNNNKTIKVHALVIYAPTGKRTPPPKILLECDPTKRHIYDGCSLKEVSQDNYFIVKTGDGKPVKNINGNVGVGLSRFITEKPRQKPKDGNSLNVSLANWI